MEGVSKIFNDFEKTKSVGCATLVKFEVDTQTSNGTRLRALINGFRGEYVSPGAYIKLIVGGELMMSDTNMEKDSNTEVIRKAHGDVLLVGLGVGLLLHNLREKILSGVVKSVTVYEKEQDVIDLVAPYYKDIPNLKIVCCDIMEYRPPRDEKYDTIYFDIWPTIDYDANLPEIRILHNRWKFHKRGKASYMNSWMKEFMQERRAADNKVRVSSFW